MSIYSAGIQAVDPQAIWAQAPKYRTGFQMASCAQMWKDERSYRVRRLADSLHEALVAPDGGRRISLTGSLVGWTNLRSHESNFFLGLS